MAEIDWNALAAEVTANFLATGQWGSIAPPTPDDGGTAPVDWDALAAEATANFLATGQWFVGSTPAPPPETDWNALAAQVTANFNATGQWFVTPISIPDARYMLFVAAVPPPATRDLWPLGGTDGSSPGLVDGEPRDVPLSAFDAFAGEAVSADSAIFRLSEGGNSGPTPSSRFVEQMGGFGAQFGQLDGRVLDDPASPVLHSVTGGTVSDHIFFLGLDAADWGGIHGLELNYRPTGLDTITLANFADVRFRLDGGSTFTALEIRNAKAGEVDARASTEAPLGLTLSLATDGQAGDNSFAVFGTPHGDDRITLHPGSIAGLTTDGSLSKLAITLGAGHATLDSGAVRAALEISGGPDPAGTNVTPGFSAALSEPGLPGQLLFGGLVFKARIAVAGLAEGSTVDVTLTTQHGPQEVNATVQDGALLLDPHVSFSAASVTQGTLLPGASGLTLLSVPFRAPGGGQHGDGSVIIASQGEDVILYDAAASGGVEILGFDQLQDRILLQHADPASVSILDLSGPQDGTLIAFDPLAPGEALHRFVFLPGVEGIALGHGVELLG